MGCVYLDHNATTPLEPAVFEAMLPYLREQFGNPSSAHRLGSEARCAIEEARALLAASLGVQAAEVVFTSGGTESNGLAIEGVARRAGSGGHIVTSAIEHASVLAACESLASRGWQVARIPVDGEGRIDEAHVVAALRPETRLVSIGWANNEIGTVQPIAEIAAVCRERGVRLHVDGVQAYGKVVVDAGCADLLSISAHKIGGPKGVGALIVRRGVAIEPILCGGPQERDRRAGTENVAGIVGFAAAVERVPERLRAASGIERLREDLWGQLAGLAGVRRNSPSAGCLPNTLNVGIDGASADALVAALDLRGIAVSSGSACAAGASEPSHVLLALGRDRVAARDAIRLSLGPQTTSADINAVAAALADLIGANAARSQTVAHA